jgi:DNA-binding XRE family transcriptional regulator
MANPNAQSAAHDAPVASADPATSGVAKAIGLRAPARLPGRAADLGGGPDRPSALDVRAEPADEPPAFTGAQLAALRRSTGLTQAAFAQKLGVTQGTVSKAESNAGALIGPVLRLALWTWQRNNLG